MAIRRFLLLTANRVETDCMKARLTNSTLKSSPIAV